MYVLLFSNISVCDLTQTGQTRMSRALFICMNLITGSRQVCWHRFQPFTAI